jgi:chorismate mutase
MSSPSITLDDLRREIDRIDDAIHELLVQRSAVGERLAAIKGNGPAIRPAREAMLLRRLAAQHQGDLPTAVLVRIWRELFAAVTALQGPFTVAVTAPGDGSIGAAAFWDLARDHYGSQTPMTAYANPLQVIGAVKEDRATVGVLPVPDDGEASPWWPALATEGRGAPRIVARLPFAARGNARGAGMDALAIACVAPEPTGEDRSHLVFAASQVVSRGSLSAAVRQTGLTPGVVAGHAETKDDAGRLYLVEVDDFVHPTDGRLDAMRQALAGNIARILPIGAYAVPLGDA